MSEEMSNPKRRRGVGDITANACRECRKKRAKCDGNTPCGRCAAQEGVECLYEIPVRVSKENMRAEIEQLSRHRQLSERLISALSRGESTDHIIRALQQGNPLEKVVGDLELSAQMQFVPPPQQQHFYQQFDARSAIYNSLQAEKTMGYLPRTDFTNSTMLPNQPQIFGGLTLDSGTSSTGTPDPLSASGNPFGSEHSTNLTPEASSIVGPLVGNWYSDLADHSIQIDRGQNYILGAPFGNEEHFKQIPMTEYGWTNVTKNISLIEHLLTLYFCWEYPTFASLSKEHFLMDFRTNRWRYCSPLVVNCILAVGARFSTHPEARKNSQDSLTAGDHFFDEAKSILDQQQEPNQLMVQALGLMSIREASCGRNTDSWFYSGQSIRMAVELGLHKELEGNTEAINMENAVRSATFWGAFALDQAWCLAIGRVPHFSRLPQLISKPAVIDNIETTEWVPYTDDGMPLERNCRQTSNVRSVYRSFCDLSEIIHKTLYLLYSPTTPLTSAKILQKYTKLLSWYGSLPEALRLGQNYTPSVLFAHMYYHFTILLLFRPFIKVKFLGSSISPREICIQAADNITALVRSYDQLYTLRRTPSFVPYIVLTSSIIHLAATSFSNAPSSSGTSRVQESTSDLKSMRECHGFAKRSLHIIRCLAKKWDIKVDNESGDEADLEDLCKPSAASMNLFCPNIDSASIANIKPNENGGANPLFAPFPMQGKPLIAVRDLARDGFELFEKATDTGD